MKRILMIAMAALALAPTLAAAQVTEPFPFLKSGDGKITMRTEPVQIVSAQPTFIVSGSANAAYATPTDTLCITGSATKVVRIYNVTLQMSATGATLATWHFVKRTTANTGGTATNPTAVKKDSLSGAATAVVNLYSAAPTTGTSAGDLGFVQAVAPANTAAGAYFALHSPSGMDAVRNSSDLRQPIVLRGVAQSVCANFAGAAWPAGGAYNWQIEWTESTG